MNMKPREFTYRRARSAISALSSSVRAAASGRARSAWPSSSSCSAPIAPRALAIVAASTISVVTWVTNVFDAATAISGPAWRNITASDSRVIAEPTVFVIATIGQPCSRAQRVGAIVSAVSPDWVTATTSVFASSGGGE